MLKDNFAPTLTLSLPRTKKPGRYVTVRKIGCFLIVTLFIFSLAACQKEEGPAEKAGKEIDKGIKSAGDAMEKTADSVKDAFKKESK